MADITTREYKMKEYMEAEGTRQVVTEAIMQAFGLGQEASKECLAFITNNQEILSEEEFIQYSKLEEYEIEGISEFVSEEGRYYISVKKSTIFLASLYLREMFPYFDMINDIGTFFGFYNLKGSFAKLDSKEGYLCILMELARNRRQGADQNLLKRFKGECCNNQLNCKYNQNGLCGCSKQIVGDICEDLAKRGVVKKRGSKYFYIF